MNQSHPLNDAMEEEFLSATGLAKKYGISSKEMFLHLVNLGLIEKRGDVWSLTNEGIQAGGKFIKGKQFGKYIVWPEDVELNISNEKLFTVSALAKHLSLATSVVQKILVNLGWMHNGVSGQLLTIQGQQAGGLEDRDVKKNTSTVRWPQSILEKDTFRQQVNEYGGEVKVLPKTEKKKVEPVYIKSKMCKEAEEASARVKIQLRQNAELIAELAQSLPLEKIRMVVTCARGSSDHASLYGKYLIEVMLGLPVVSMGPSLGSMYNRKMDLSDCLFLAVSQSGMSPDLISCSEWAVRNGATVVGMINNSDTPIHSIAHAVIPLRAGKEQSVAATKSYICTLTAFAQLVAEYKKDADFTESLLRLPEQLAAACELDWSHGLATFAKAKSFMVAGRGVSYGIAMEAALKFKETACIHAEGFSCAELMHGPLALVNKGFPVLVFSQEDETKESVRQTVKVLREKGASVFVVEAGDKQQDRLPMISFVHPFLAPVLMIQKFYLFVEEVAVQCGFDPDNPPHLNKVTKTV